MVLIFCHVMDLVDTTIFGVALEEACFRSSSLLPLPLSQAIKWLNTKGLDEEGLYRVPGCHGKIEEYKSRFDKGKQWRYFLTVRSSG